MSGVEGAMLLPVTDGDSIRFALVDQADWDRVSKLSWFMHSAGYAQAHCPEAYQERGGKKVNNAGVVLLHRFVMGAPKGRVVDHLNGEKLDCRRRNLRVCTQAENMMNTAGHRRRKSKFRGVSRNMAGNFQVNIRGRYVGSRKTEEEAGRLWDEVARREGVPEHRLNFPRMN